ncbi:heme A synthase [Streptomyces sp. NPDC058985]|uniref:COX15/CtaA family protein n=1 Tax=Streptomyces sp. NPDC058985 TaxID=3346684 RepID=UPI0036BD0BAE
MTPPRTPFARLAARWNPPLSTVRRATTTALVMSVVIVVTGGAVRLTGSGLGCPTWPTCTDTSLTTTAAMGWHGVIEFGNRLLTYVLAASVGWVILAARCIQPVRRDVLRLAWGQFALVVANALLGGITVLTGLNPYTVAGHFLLSTALITLAYLARNRTAPAPAPAGAGDRASRVLARALLTACALLITAGTVVTGAGPHAGDSGDIARIPLDWTLVTRVHSALAWTVLALALLLHTRLRRTEAPHAALHRARLLLAVLVVQGAVGYLQSVLGLPELLVGLHMLGSCLMWIATLHVTAGIKAANGPSTQEKDRAAACSTR